eukprot:2726880-Prorocentrum_lima.AAC.1
MELLMLNEAFSSQLSRSITGTMQKWKTAMLNILESNMNRIRTQARVQSSGSLRVGVVRY